MEEGTLTRTVVVSRWTTVMNIYIKIREIKTWLNINHITVHNNILYIF